MKKIYISAYCNANFGDDLFIYLLSKRYNCNFYICCNPSKNKAFVKLKNVKYPSYISWFILKVIKKIFKIKYSIRNTHKIKTSDAIVKIGGSIFIEKDNWKYNWIDSEKPLFIIGANYGPAKTQEYYSLVESKISDSESCCFRDRYSYKLFNHLPNVYYAPDVLFGINIYDIIQHSSNQKGISISVINVSDREDLYSYSDGYYTTIAKVIDFFIGLNIPITLLGFCKSEGDDIAIAKIIKMIKNQDIVNTVTYDGNIKTFLEVIESCETIIATRFHAMILGWVMKKNVIPIIYSNKQTNVIDDVQFSGDCYKISDIKSKEIDIIRSCLERKGFLNNLDLIRKESSKQFYSLDNFMRQS